MVQAERNRTNIQSSQMEHVKISTFWINLDKYLIDFKYFTRFLPRNPRNNQRAKWGCNRTVISDTYIKDLWIYQKIVITRTTAWLIFVFAWCEQDIANCLILVGMEPGSSNSGNPFFPNLDSSPPNLQALFSKLLLFSSDIAAPPISLPFNPTLILTTHPVLDILNLD